MQGEEGSTGSAFFLSFSLEAESDFLDFLEDGPWVLVLGGSLSLSAIEEISGLSSYSDSLEHSISEEEMGRLVIMYRIVRYQCVTGST
jgi:hypothetical protein